MSALAFKVSRKSGEYVQPSLAPTPATQSHFGLWDAVIAGFFLLGAGGLIYLLLRL